MFLQQLAIQTFRNTDFFPQNWHI